MNDYFENFSQIPNDIIPKGKVEQKDKSNISLISQSYTKLNSLKLVLSILNPISNRPQKSTKDHQNYSKVFFITVMQFIKL